MKVLLVNVDCGVGSTGRICTELASDFIKNKDQCTIAYGRDCKEIKNSGYTVKKIGNQLDLCEHLFLTRCFDLHGFGSKRATRDFLKWADEYDPDLLWLHNIHGYYLNIELLFNWIKSRPNMKVNWTLHDCWAFTGHCGYFSIANCEKWKTECKYCPNRGEYPSSILFDGSTRNYIRKRELFTGVKDMTIYTPSYWLADLVKQSFLKGYTVKVKYNTINRSVFKPTYGSFREIHHLGEKVILLGVANVWHPRKGLDDFLQLEKMLDDRFVIVLVGLTERQIKALPATMIGIQRTNSMEELAEIYTTADLFLNPSREETFGMTTLEALSCGTNVVVYKDTACEEIVKQIGGVAVEQGVENLFSAVMSLTSHEEKNDG